VTPPTFDRSSWEARWSEVLREHGDQVATRPPNAHLIAAAEPLRAGLALDAGCGHGAETLWLAAHGWHVTAVDFSTAALTHARSTAESIGADVASRIDWVEGDLSTWTPRAEYYDLVFSLYVHVAGSVEAVVQRLANRDRPGRDVVPRRPPADRPGHRSRDGSRGSGAGLRRSRGRARSRPLGRRHCRGPTASHGRHRRRRRHLRAPSVLTFCHRNHGVRTRRGTTSFRSNEQSRPRRDDDEARASARETRRVQMRRVVVAARTRAFMSRREPVPGGSSTSTTATPPSTPRTAFIA
jgi:SAM-dependent methyltransferase